MLFSYQIPVLPEGASLPRPELLLLQVQRDNLIRQNGRLVRQIEELTRQIEQETTKISAQQERIFNQRAMSA